MSTYKVPSTELRNAYNRTLKESASHSCNPVTFQCDDDSTNSDGPLDCDSCPLHGLDCSHTHNFADWQKIWCHMTGEKDERTPEDVLNSASVITTPEEAKDILDSHRRA